MPQCRGTLRVATRAGAEVIDFAHPDAGPEHIQAMQRKAAAFFGRPAGEDAG
ncbi:MAG: hypothetical protein M5R40_21965 [Anaerolineae bacterium]|nr:hypothetical protein [Anaerolineae bacterium]